MSMSAGTRFHFDRLYGMSPQQYELISVYQVGDIGCHADFRLETHTQSCYEIVYVLSGRGWLSINGERFAVEEGDLHIVNPGATHAGGVDPDLPYRCFYLGFMFNDNWRGESGESPFEPIRQSFEAAAEAVRDRGAQTMNGGIRAVRDGVRAVRDRLGIQHPVRGLLSELRRANEHAHLMMQSYLNQIVVLAYRNAFSDGERDDQYRKDLTSAEKVVYNAVSYIDSRLLEIRHLTEISAALGYSYSYLSHLFVRQTGVSLRHFFAQKKWRAAVELLAAGSYSVTEISAMLQFQSVHAFSKAFKKATGVSPTAYIELHVTFASKHN